MLDARTALQLLRRRWMLIVASTVLAAVVSAIMTWWATPEYAAQAMLSVSVRNTGLQPGYTDFLGQSGRFAQYTSLFRDPGVMADLRGRSGLSGSSAGLVVRADMHTPQRTILLVAIVTSTSPRQAERAADAVVGQLSQFVPQVEGVADRRKPPVWMRIVHQAGRRTVPVSPIPPRNLAFGLAVGLLGGVGLILVRGTEPLSVAVARQPFHLNDGARSADNRLRVRSRARDARTPGAHRRSGVSS